MPERGGSYKHKAKDCEALETVGESSQKGGKRVEKEGKWEEKAGKETRKDFQPFIFSCLPSGPWSRVKLVLLGPLWSVLREVVVQNTWMEEE